MKQIRLWHISGTSKALCFSKVPKNQALNASGIWIPKSLLGKIEWMEDKVGEWKEANVEVADWFAVKKGLI